MENKWKKNYYRIFGGITGLIVLIIIVKFVLAISQTKIPSFSIPKEYLELFKDSIRTELKNGIAYNSKNRTTISTFNLDKRYGIIVCRLKVSRNFTLDSIDINHFFNQKTTNIVYSIASLGYYDLQYDPKDHAVINNVHLSFDGSMFNVLSSNDSVISYYIRYAKLGISYNEGIYADIFWQLNPGIKSVPINIVFKKSKERVYLIAMTVNDPTIILPEGLLQNILNE